VSTPTKKNISLSNLILQKKTRQDSLLLLLKVFFLQIFFSILILTIQILNLQYKISNYLNFNSRVFNILGYTFIVPLLSFDENGAWIFRICISSFFSILASQIVKLLYLNFKANLDSKIKKDPGKNEDFNISFIFTTVPLLICTDLVRDVLNQLDINLQVIMMMKFTISAFFLINFLKFIMGGFRRVLNIVDDDVIKNGKFLNQNNNKSGINNYNWRKTFAYLYSVCLVTLIPSVFIVALNYTLNNFPYLTSWKLECQIFSVNFLFLTNNRNALIIGILAKICFDLINRFIEFNDEPSKDFNIKNLLDVKKRWRTDPNFSNLFECCLLSVLNSMCMIIVVSINISFLKDYEKINNQEKIYAVAFTLSITILLMFCARFITLHNEIKKDEKEFILINFDGNQNPQPEK
jgi:hypothetical protein